jgi:hypothetical protein
MPYKLRKAPKRDLYWVVTIETGKKHSKDPIPKDKAKAQLRILESALEGSGKVIEEHLNKLKREQKIIDRKIYSTKKEIITYMRSKGMTHTTQLEPDNKLMKKRRNLIEEYERISREISKWEAIDDNDGDYIEEEEEEPEDAGKRGGMMRVNPLAQPTPKEIVTKAVQAKLDTANAIRATSITNKDGHKSMEKIMNEVALELAKAGKAGAVTYLNELRAPFESRDEYKQDDSSARNQIARELGFTIKGGAKRGGMYGNPPPSRRAEAIRAYFARNPHLRNPELGQAPVQTTNPLRQATAPRAPAAPAVPAIPVVPNNGVTEVVQAGCNVLGSCFGTGKKRKCRKCGLPKY